MSDMINSPGPPTQADLGAAITLRHLENAAKNASPSASVLEIVRTARDTLFAEIEQNAEMAGIEGKERHANRIHR